MARPEKKGLQSFQFDVDFFDDEKIETIAGEFGIKGEIVAIKLLCAIYRNGYYIEWSETYRTKLLRNLAGISPGLLDSIVLRLVKCEFFDEAIFDSTKVLTSRGIQRRYFSETRRRRNSSLELPFLLIEEDNKPKIPTTPAVPEMVSVHMDFGVTAEDDKSGSPPDNEHLNNILQDLQRHTMLRDNLCMRFNISPEDLLSKFNEFILECQCRELIHFNRNDALNHFFSWLKKSNTEQNNAHESATARNKRRGTEAIPPSKANYNGTF